MAIWIQSWLSVVTTNISSRGNLTGCLLYTVERSRSEGKKGSGNRVAGGSSFLYFFVSRGAAVATALHTDGIDLGGVARADVHAGGEASTGTF